jgi:N-acetylglucosaminyldiphosphoundecaprenol N-acetyl-beta-D-mannosaminyltransferase
MLRMLTRSSEATVDIGDDVGLPSRSPAAYSMSSTPLPQRVSEPVALPIVRIGGVEFHAITEDQCVRHILSSLADGVGGTVVTPNLDITRRCRHDLKFAALVSESDLVVADGMPLVWASRLQGTPLPQRLAGSDLIGSLSAAAAIEGRSIFLLGGDPGTAEGAAGILAARAPGLRVAGTYCPPMGFDKDEAEMGRMIELLRQSRPDIVWVALGSPKQEMLINRIRHVLPQAWWLGVGISFSFLTGEVKRAPRWVQKIGMEWVHRMKQEPGRLMKRYLVHGLPFAARLLGGALANRLNGKQEQLSGVRRTRVIRTRRPETVPAQTNGHAYHAHLNRTSTMAVVAVQSSGTAVATLAPPVESERSELTIFSRSESSMGKGLKRLKAIILLGGKVRHVPLSALSGRSLLDLPLDENGSILNGWITQSADLAARSGLSDMLVRVIIDSKAMEPYSVKPSQAANVRIERDRWSFRGTGGLIADIAKDYDDDDLILVGNASQVLLEPLWAIAAALDHKTGDFTMISHRDGTASGLMLMSCKTVRGISDVGYVDLKEQALPNIAKSHDVRVVHCRQPTGLPIFTLPDYISAIQHHYRRRERRRARTNPLSEDFSKHFAIVEEGATVAPDAYLHDSVVLRGATVESGAAAIRSLLCPTALIGRGQIVSDQLMGDC